MKKLVLVSALVLGVSALSFAQGRKPNPAKQAEKLKTSLSLNDDQTAKIKAIYEAQAKSFDSIATAAGADADKKSLMQKRKPIVVSNTAKIKAVLTADQATAFQKELESQGKKRKKNK